MAEGRSLFNRLRALFLRYASHHEATACGAGLPRHRLRRVGNIEAVALQGDGMRLTGWTSADMLHVSWPGGSCRFRPDRPRRDVCRHVGGPPRDMGFDVTLPQTAYPVRISVRLPSGRMGHVRVRPPGAPRTVRTRLRLWRAFCRDMIRAMPAFAAYALNRRDAHKHAIKSALGLTRGLPVPVLDAAWFGDPPVIPSPAPFTIIMPVHNGFDLLRAALDRVARHTGGDWHIVLVDDASTDARVVPWLTAWCAAQGGRAEMHRLQRNAGFVAAVNRGLAIAARRPGHVVLLNSDALVPSRWAERLLAPLAEPAVASVTPFSNNAEIFSAPLPVRATDMAADLADRLDAVAQTLGVPATRPSAPTGVGFCMGLSRDWLARVPRLDQAFGRGYGEEVDWCQRVRALGGQHVAQPGLFVHHAGGASFGAEKAPRVAVANAILAKRYPRYDGEVQRFIQHDPLRTPRLTLGLAYAGFTATGPLPVYLAHSLGGGADLAMEQEIARDLDTCGAAVVVRVGGALRFTVELRMPDGRLDGATSSFDTVRAMLAAVPRLRIIYSCGVGDPDAFELPELLLQLRRDVLLDRCEARLHDYFTLSPSYCLLGETGRYRGPVSRQTRDAAHRFRTRSGTVIGLPDWRTRWQTFLSACDEITAFSRSSAEIFGAAYPALAHRVAVRAPAQPPLPPPAVARAGPEARTLTGTGREIATGTLGILGNLNAQKGAGVVEALVRRLDQAGDRRPVVVIGNVDAAFALPARVRIHGGYRREDIAALTRRYGVATWIVPAVWPETYSFSTREALATGLPVVAFDIGAQGEVVGQASNGVAVPYDPDADLAARLLAALPLARSGPVARACEPASSLREMTAS